MIIPEDNRKIAPCMLITITKVEDGKKLEKLFDTMHVSFWHQCRGKGTAPSEIMDIFGLSGTTRLITFTFLPKYKAKKVLAAMNRHLSFCQKGGGIAFSIPVTGMQAHMLHLLKEEAREKMEQHIEERLDEDMAEIKSNQNYVMVWVSAASGYSDEVIDAARAAGARGGTVIKGRRRNSERISQRLGFSTQDEQDFVMIVVPKAKKAEIMTAISENCGLHTPVHGIVLSLPIDDVIGLEE